MDEGARLGHAARVHGVAAVGDALRRETEAAYRVALVRLALPEQRPAAIGMAQRVAVVDEHQADAEDALGIGEHGFGFAHGRGQGWHGAPA